MMGEDLLAQPRAVEVQVYLGGRDAFMAEHLLDGAQVGSPFEQMGGERVAQGVGRYGLCDAGGCGETLDDGENHLARQPAPAPAQEQVGLFAAPDGEGGAFGQIPPDPL